MCLSAGPIQAQPASDRTYDFDIPAQPLVEALKSFSLLTRRQVAASGEAIRGVASLPVSGQLTARDALQRMTAATGLTIVEVNGTDFALRAAAAQSAPAGSARAVRTMEEMIVYGTKQNRSLLDTQASVEVFDQTRIEREVALSFDDIILRTPNLSSNGTTSDITIRGVNIQGSARGIGTGNTINIYVDGAPLSNFNGIESLWDVEQVEVLRGPQSTVQGRNALAGAVVIATRDPTYEYEAAAQLRIGSNDIRQYSGVVSGPLIDGQLAARLAVDYQEFEGDARHAVTGDPTEILEGLEIRGKLLVEPDAAAGLRIDLQGDFIDTDSGNLNLIGFPLRANEPGFDEFDPFGELSHGTPTQLSIEVVRGVARVDYEVSPSLNLVGIGTYEDSSQAQLQGDTGNPSLFAVNGDFAIDNEIHSAEFRAEFEQERWSGWLGAYYFQQDSSSGGISFLALSNFFPVVPADSVGRAGGTIATDTENYALFGEIRFQAAEQWEFEFGLRYDHEEFVQSSLLTPGTVDPADCTIDPIVPLLGGAPCSVLFPPTAAAPDQSTSFDAWLPRGAIVYSFDDRRSISLGVQRGYRAGGSFVRTAPDASGVTQTTIGAFDPEFLLNYELAFRGQWLDQRLTMLLNVFYSDWTDQQIRVPGPSGLVSDVLFLNAGSSELYGAEFSLSYLVSDTLDVRFAAGLVETEFEDFAFAVDGDGNPVNGANPRYANLAGNEFALSPNVTLSVGAYYAHPDGFFGDLTVNHTGGQFSDIENLPIDESDAFTLVSLRSGYRTDRFEIYAFADNLLDEEAILESLLANVSTSTGAVEFSGTPSVRINRPRTVGVGIKVDF